MCPLQKPRVKRSYIRWERKYSNSLWQCDLKLVESRWLITILTDHGSQFYSVRHGESAFTQFCSGNGITHILGGIGKPTTLGKIERWFRTYDQEHTKFQLHRKFIEYYNYERPHMRLNYKTPAEVYYKDVPNVVLNVGITQSY